MRPARRASAVVLLMILLPMVTVSVTATPPTVPQPIAEMEFKPVTLPVQPRPTLSWDIHAEIVDRIQAPPPRPTARPAVPQPAPKAVVVVKKTPASGGGGVASSGNGRLSGKASYYCSAKYPTCARGYPIGSYVAAAGPKLRIAMGGGAPTYAPDPWRGKTVKVCKTGTSTCVNVKLVDWCQCYWRQPHEKIIDLYYAPFSVVGGNVTITW